MGKKTRSRMPAALSLLTILSVGACAATPPPPRDEIAAAELALNRAREAQAREFAALEMDLSQKKLEEARAIATKQDEDAYPRAVRLAQQALVDAQLAEAKARAARTQRIEKEMQKTIEALREETRRNAETKSP